MQGSNRPQNIKSEFINKKENGLTMPQRTKASLASKKGNTVNKQTLKANNEKLKYSNQINDQKKANLPTTKTKSNIKRDASKDITQKSNNYNEKDLNKLMQDLKEDDSRDTTQIMKKINDCRRGNTKHKSDKKMINNNKNQEVIPKSNNYKTQDLNKLMQDLKEDDSRDTAQIMEKINDRRRGNIKHKSDKKMINNNKNQEVIPKSNKDWTQYFKELILALKRDASKDITNLTNDEKMQCLNKLVEDLQEDDSRDITQIMEEINNLRGGNTQYKSNNNNENPDWFRNTFLVRAKEILVLLSFIVGITFTVLIATGILGWGMLALGIFEAFGFLGASHLFGTLSLTDAYHADGPNGERYWGNPLLKDKHKTGDKDEDEKRLETISDILSIFKFIVFPLIFLSGGITLIILGNAGIIGLSLGLVLGIPSIIASLSVLNSWMRDKDNRSDKELRSGWRKFVFVTGILAVATFFVLSFTGVFALPVAVGFALPVIGFDLWTLAVKRIECCIRNREETEEEYDLSLPITEQNIHKENENFNGVPIPQFVSNQTQDKSRNGQ